MSPAGHPVLSAALVVLFTTAVAAQLPMGEEKQALIEQAQALHREALDRGVDLGPGPCLGIVGGDWAVDVVHVPRSSADERPGNQCEAYRSGQVGHFIELDARGELVRMR